MHTQNGDGAEGNRPRSNGVWAVARVGAALQAYHQELRDALIPILADFLKSRFRLIQAFER